MAKMGDVFPRVCMRGDGIARLAVTEIQSLCLALWNLVGMYRVSIINDFGCS